MGSLTTEDFLHAILPAKGWYYAGETIALDNGRQAFRNSPYQSIADLAAYLQGISAGGGDAYFAMASYKERSYYDHTRQKTRTRTAENAYFSRAFWFDIDCGADQPYASKQAGIQALKKFLSDTGLPAPTHVVDSGGGLHVYWATDTDFPKQKWQQIAERLKRLAIAAEFKADYKCTADIARVLRPAGTLNTKYESPREVKALGSPRPPVGAKPFLTALLHACEQFEVSAKSTPSNDSRPEWLRDGEYASDLTPDAFQQGVGYTPPDAELMASKCQMLGRMRETKGADQTYLEWFYSLTLLEKSQQGESICHEWSQGYEHYDPADCDSKIVEVREGKPVLCETVRNDLPEVCEGCPQTCNSAVSLGFPAITTPESVIDHETGEVEQIEMASIHEAEFRWTEDRGLERHVTDNEGNARWHRVCQLLPLLSFIWVDDNRDKWTRMYVRKRLGAYETADIPLSSIGQGGSALTRELAGKGGLVVDARSGGKHMEQYMKTWIDHSMQNTDFGALARWMGWQRDGSFLLGSTVFHRDGSKTTAAVSNSLVKAVTEAQPKGSLEQYVQAVDELYNRPGRTHFQVAWMASLASALIYLDSESPVGLVFGITSPISGVGKTSVALMGMAAWGDPTEGEGTLGAKQTTEHAMFVTAGMRRNLPVLIDETTDWTTDALARFLYSYSIGQPKAQGSADGGLRDNSHLRWYNVCYLTTNKHGSEDLIAAGGNAEPKIARLFEVDFPNLQDEMREHAGRHSALIKQATKKNCGQAGPAFIEALMPLVDQMPEAIQRQSDWLREQTGVGTVGRYWLQMGACLLVSFAIAKKAGLHKFEAAPFRKEIVRTIKALSRRAASAVPTGEDILSKYLTSIHSGLIVTREMGTSGRNSVFLNGYGPPRGEVTGRVVAEGPDAGIYLPIAQFKRWCSEHNMNYQSAREDLLASGMLKDESCRVYLGKGTGVPSGRSRAWHLDYNLTNGSLSAVPSGQVAEPQEITAVE